MRVRYVESHQDWHINAGIQIVLAFCLFDILTIFGNCDQSEISLKWCELPAVRVTIDQGVIQLSLTWLEH
jgi:hypothetical protein